MALDLANLARVAGGDGFSIWVYKTTDAATDVDTAGYFNGAASILNLGDMIVRQTFATTAFASLSSAGIHTVNSISSGVVDVGDAVNLLAADTD